jgi:DNA-binding MarR family transcriptional regulator
VAPASPVSLHLQRSPRRYGRVAAPLIELERFLPYRISVLANVMSTAIAATYEVKYGLTIPEWRVIAVLKRYPGLSAREVAEKTRMDAVAVSRAVNRLLRAGRLRRAVASDDRRRSVLQVSAAGAAVYRKVAPLALEFERTLLEALVESDRVDLHRMIDVLTERAETLSSRLRAERSQQRRKPKVARATSKNRARR